MTPIQIHEQPTGVTRRKFIKGVIAAGAAVSASTVKSAERVSAAPLRAVTDCAPDAPVDDVQS